MRAHSAKYRSGNLLTIVCHREAADDFEAKASQKRRLELFQMRAEAGKRKAFLRDLGDFLVSAKISFSRALEFGDLAGSKRYQPSLRIGFHLSALPGGRDIDLPWRAMDPAGH
jgi:hypothetical protein